MARTLRYHPRVPSDDLSKIPVQARQRIARAIEARLTTSPEHFGVPLKGSLHGFWKLRIGDYRVVFKVDANDVWILAVLHRKDVYDRAERRL